MWYWIVVKCLNFIKSIAKLRKKTDHQAMDKNFNKTAITQTSFNSLLDYRIHSLQSFQLIYCASFNDVSPMMTDEPSKFFTSIQCDFRLLSSSLIPLS